MQKESLSIQLPDKTRHFLDMIEKLLKCMADPVTQTQTPISLFQQSNLQNFLVIFFLILLSLLLTVLSLSHNWPLGL